MGKEDGDGEVEDIMSQVLGRAEVNDSNQKHGFKPHGALQATRILRAAIKAQKEGEDLEYIQQLVEEAVHELTLDRQAERLIRQEKKGDSN